MPCSANTHSFLKDLPKCEHHLHLEGTLMPSLVFSLAKTNNITLPEQYTTVEALEARYKQFANLEDFLWYYYQAMGVLIGEHDFQLLAEEYMKQAHEDGVVHAEVFFDPQAHTTRSVPLPAVIAGLTAGLRSSCAKYNMTYSLIACFVRHLPVEHAITTVEDVVPYIKSGEIKGIGMDSTEIGNPPEKWIPVYEKARALGVPDENLTAHVGEEGSAEDVQYVVEKMGINRIDHGIHSADSDAVLDSLASAGTFLTLCPLSNVALRTMSSVSEHPLPKFMAKGIKFSINSDDPAYFNGYILDNYLAVQDTFGFDKKVWEGLMKDAVEGSWCDRKRKDEILAILAGVMKKWEGKDLD